jgi:hypothetical protein
MKLSFVNLRLDHLCDLGQSEVTEGHQNNVICEKGVWLEDFQDSVSDDGIRVWALGVIIGCNECVLDD